MKRTGAQPCSQGLSYRFVTDLGVLGYMCCWIRYVHLISLAQN